MRNSVIAMVAILAPTAVVADEIVWKTVLETPKGLNLPSGIQPDILGIAIGDTLEEVRTKLEALDPEAMSASGIAMPDTGDVAAMAQYMAQKRAGVDMSAPFQEQITSLYMQGPTPIEANYISGMTLEREVEGDASEYISVTFSAPSSGSQAIAISRRLELRDQNNQVRISQLIDALAQRFGSAPDMLSTGQYKYQFDDGKRVAPQGGYDCFNFAETWGTSANTLENINPDGTCDVGYDISFGLGISDEHARSVTFALYDNERAKANLGADFRFFDDYVEQVRAGTGGAVPAL